jgi:8-oxo-dGTP pyrophosphatase MutT (NUDIX family)
MRRRLKRLRAFRGAGVLFYTVEEGKISVLLGRRSVSPGKNTWSISGGKWDRYNDGYDQERRPDYVRTAVRETEEELHYTIDDLSKLVLVWKMTLKGFFVYRVYAYQLDKKIAFSHNREFYEVGWFGIDELPKTSNFLIPSQVRKLQKMSKQPQITCKKCQKWIKK